MSVQLVEQVSGSRVDNTVPLDMTFASSPVAGELLVLVPFHSYGLSPRNWVVPAGFELTGYQQKGHGTTRTVVFTKVSDGTEQTLALEHTGSDVPFGAFAYRISSDGGVRLAASAIQDEGSDDPADANGDWTRTVTTLPSSVGDLVIATAGASGSSSMVAANVTWSPASGLTQDDISIGARGAGTYAFDSTGNDTITVVSSDVGSNIRFACVGLTFEETAGNNPDSPTFRKNLSNVPTPKAEWRFDAANGGNDVAGIKDAVLSGTADATALHFESAGAKDFQSDGVAKVSKSTPVLPHSGDFSLEWSIGPITTDFAHSLESRHEVNDGGITVQHRDTGDFRLRTYSGGTQYSPAADPIVDPAVGHHFVLIKSGSQFIAYADGTEILNETLPHTHYHEEPFLWGNRHEYSQGLRPIGFLDEAAVWYEALTATAVSELYTAYDTGAPAGTVLALDQATLTPGATVSGSYSGYVSEAVGPLVISDGNPNPIEVSLTFSNATQDGDNLWSGDFTGTMPDRPADGDTAPWVATGAVDVTLADPGA